MFSVPLSLVPSRRNNLAFYSPAGHHAAFALPPVALKELAKPRPSLSDTSADLESIMAYGEEGEDKMDDRWEPDVRNWRAQHACIGGCLMWRKILRCWDEAKVLRHPPHAIVVSSMYCCCSWCPKLLRECISMS